MFKIILIILLSFFLIFLVFKQFPKPASLIPDFKGKNLSLKTKNIEIKKLSIENIFNNSSDTSSYPQDKLITIIATGDIIPARSVNFQTVSRNNFLWPYEKTADVIKNADLTFANLETPLLKNCPLTQEGMIFCGSDKNTEGLVFSGIDIISLANNHAGNYGESGVEETKNLLEQNNISVTGLGDSIVKDVKGTKFAFLGYNDITSPQPGVLDVDEEKIKQDIKKAKEKADVVIVTYHWGVEYRSQPDDRQKYLGKFTIDAGADLVIGNHPHWVQPVEIYKGKLITYAHGNFVFDQMWSQKTREGVVGKYTFYDKNLVDVKYFPIQIDNYGQPFFLEKDQKQRILKEMFADSLILEDSAP